MFGEVYHKLLGNCVEHSIYTHLQMSITESECLLIQGNDVLIHISAFVVIVMMAICCSAQI